MTAFRTSPIRRTKRTHVAHFSVLGLLLSASTVLSSSATSEEPSARVELVAIDSFGRALQNCRVGFFTSRVPNVKNYSSSFHELSARKIPLGTYLASLSCEENSGVASSVPVNGPDVFAVVSSPPRGDIVHYAPGKAPLMRVRIKGHAALTTVWIKLVGVYLNEVQVRKVDFRTGEAQFVNPPPGRYQLMLLAADHILCSQVVDVLDPRAGIALDLKNGCALMTDEYSRPVE